jgi:hypothetical protein
MLTGLLPNSKNIGSWFGDASRSSSVSADIRTIMACFGFEWTVSPGRECPCRDNATLGRGIGKPGNADGELI